MMMSMGRILSACAVAMTLLLGGACSSPAANAPGPGEAGHAAQGEPSSAAPQPIDPDTAASSAPAPEDLLTPAPPEVCDHGIWIPDVQEPASYVACAADADCGRAVIEGCCSVSYVALRRDRACVAPLGADCDRVCDEVLSFPPGGAERAVACVEGRCELLH